MEEHRGEAIRRQSTVGTLSAVCTALAVTVLAGGVAMFNNYKKMHEMESVIASVLPEGRIKEAKAGVWPIEEKFPKGYGGGKAFFCDS